MIDNPLQLRYLDLPLSWPQGGVLPAAALSAPLAAAAALARAQAEHDRLAEEARTLRQEALAAAQTERAALLAQAESECQALRQQTRAEAIDEAIHWMVAEAELENEAARLLMRRWRPVLVHAITTLLGEEQTRRHFWPQLEQRVLELLPQGRLQLSVTAAALSAATARFARHAEVAVAANPELEDGQAILDNGQVLVRLDWPAYQARLLWQLSHGGPEAMHG